MGEIVKKATAGKSALQVSRRGESSKENTAAELSVGKAADDRLAVISYMDEHPEDLGTLAWICRSKMLKNLAKEKRATELLPDSNVYWSHVCRSQKGQFLVKMSNTLSYDILSTLLTGDGDVVTKLFARSTGLTKSHQTPTYHIDSLVDLLCEQHRRLGSPLDHINWEMAAKEEKINWQECGFFKAIRGEDDWVIAIEFVPTGQRVALKYKMEPEYVIHQNWLVADAVLNVEDESEDPINLQKRFAAMKDPIVMPLYSAEEVAEVEASHDYVAEKVPGQKSTKKSAADQKESASSSSSKKRGSPESAPGGKGPVLKAARKPKGVFSTS